MSKWSPARWKARPRARRLTAFLAALALALGVAAVAGGPAYASGENCMDNDEAVLCINVHGASNIINDIIGSATTDIAFSEGDTGHVQVTDPNGKTLCNSHEVPVTDSEIYLSCVWNGKGARYPTGDYCTTFWVYMYRGLLGWEYTKIGPPECLNVFS